MFIKLLAITLILMVLIFLGFSLKILLKKKGEFPEIHVGHNKEMKKRGIYCVKIVDKMEFNNSKDICQLKSSPECQNCKKP